MKLEGVFTALVTPFKNGEVDCDALAELARRQLDAGVHGLVPLGSTGEAATIDEDERARVIETVVKVASGRAPVIVGAGTNCTRTTIALVKQAKSLGADAALVVTPYYNKPTPDGLVAHFEAVAEAVDLPMVAYNVPGRTGLNLLPKVADRLADMPRVVGLKEASGDMSQAMELARLTAGKWSLLSGEDGLFMPFLAIGGQGVISVISNIVPERFVGIFESFMEGDIETARKKQLELLPLIGAMFSLTNPIPVKAAVSLMGICENELRLPLTPMEGKRLEELRALLIESAVIGHTC